MNDREDSFTSACLGCPSAEVVAAIAAYQRLERSLPKADLDLLHFYGARELMHSEVPLEKFSLSNWRGFADLERSLLRAVGVAPERRDALISYGCTTAEIFRSVLEAVGGARVMWTQNLYDPWRQQVCACFPAGLAVQTSDLLQGPFRGHTDEMLISRMTEAISRFRPQVVFVSHVTQLGIRIPLDRIIERVADRCARNGFSLPLWVIDVCQSVGRVPVGNEPVWSVEPRCAYIGCVHKALRGPREMAFLVCRDWRWRDRLVAACARHNDLVRFARQQEQVVTTVSCTRAIGAGVALRASAAIRTRKAYARVLHLQHQLQQSLDSRWTVCNGADPSLWSGVVSIRAPESLAQIAHPGTLQELAGTGPAAVHVDEVFGLIRIAIEARHRASDIRRLARALNHVVAA